MRWMLDPGLAFASVIAYVAAWEALSEKSVGTSNFILSH
jgi:hypothetical protein